MEFLLKIYPAQGIVWEGLVGILGIRKEGEGVFIGPELRNRCGITLTINKLCLTVKDDRAKKKLTKFFRI